MLPSTLLKIRRWSETSHEKLQVAFLRDAPRTRLELDGVVIDDFDAAFWEILK